MTKEEALRAYGKRLAEHYEFCQLVRRMREAQEALLDSTYKTLSETEVCKVRAWALEREVDEYLKKM